MATSLLDWILDLLRDPDARESFFDEPDRYAQHHGFDHLSTADVHDALLLAAADGFPSPRHFERLHEHDGGHHDGVHFLRGYLHENRVHLEDRHTDFDNSLHQRVDTDGGDFRQHVDSDTVIASGDHAVAAGGDIGHSTITSGDHNVVGSGNHVAGEHSTVAFGQGSATHSSFDDAHFGSGSAVSLSGNARGEASHNESLTSVHGGDGHTTVNQVGEHSTANQFTDQHEIDNSQHVESENNSHTNTHTDFNSHNPADIHDVHL